MKVKKLLKIIIIIIAMLITYSSTIKAASGGPMYLILKGKSTERETGTYVVNNKAVFKIVKSNSSGTVENDDGTVIYCLKGGPGFGSESYDNTVIGYTQYFDIKNPDSITGSYRNQLPSDMTTYNELVWVLDHLYNPENETMDEYLERVGIWSSSKFRNGTIPEDEVKDIVEVTEQVAIWYFTNPSGDPYHNNYTNTLEIEVDGESLIDKYRLDIVDNEVSTIYSYLVQGAINAVRDGYTYESDTSNPVTLNSDSVGVEIEDDNYIIGPYRIEKNNDTSYTLSATITDGSSTIQNVKILNQNKQEITAGSNLSQKINSTVGSDFYISVPISTNVDKVRLEVTVNAQVTAQLMWTVGANELSINQPVVIIDKVDKNYSSSSEVELQKPNGSYNLKLVKQDSLNSNKLQGARFTIKINNGQAQTYETNSNGEININDIGITDTSSNDTILITEIEAPDGYVLINTPITLTITKSLQNGKYVASSVSSSVNSDPVENGSINITQGANGVNTVNITINNEQDIVTGAYSFKLIKQDASGGGRLQGARFRIRINEGTTNEYITNSNGEVEINGINITDISNNDTITITEIAAPDGYILDSEPINLTIKKSQQNGKYVAESVSMVGSNNSQDDVTIVEDESGINIIQLVLNNSKKSGSYKFRLVKQDSQTKERLQNFKFTIKINNGQEREYTTNNNGEITIDDISITNIGEDDTITITEIETQNGYTLNNTPIVLTVTKGEDGDKYVASAVSSNINSGLVESGSVQIEPGSDGINTVLVTINNTKKSGSYNFKLLKKDASNGQNLQGVKFRISINGASEQEYTTNVNGEITIDGINIANTNNDTIVITEIETPTGYILNNTPITLTVTKEEQGDRYIASGVTSNINSGLVENGSVQISNGSNGVNTVNITVNNSSKAGSYNLKLVKQDSQDSNSKLEGVKFRISINGAETNEYTTDRNGEITINNIQITDVVSADKITITEITAPDGYVLNSTPITLTIVKTEENDEYVASSVTSDVNSGLVENGSVNITTGPNGVNTVNITINNTKITGSYNFKIIKEDMQTHETLGGAIFAVKVNNEAERQVETDSNGEISIEDIAITDTTSQDTITIREVRPPDEYSSFSGIITLKVNKTENNGQYTISSVDATLDGGTQYDDVTIVNNSGALTVQVTIPNEKVEGSYNLKIVKQDEYDENKKLEGATFNITTNVSGEESTHSYTTNENGEINITNPINGDGEHYRLTITETTAPEGYDSVLTSPIVVDAYTTVSNGEYILENVNVSSEATNWEYDEETNTITIIITNRKQPFDLALRKYITHINGEEVSPSREPQISDDETQAVADGNATFDDGTTAEKDHIKTPLIVQTGDIVRYTIRIYNEGKIDGYAKEITDYLPEGLELVPQSESRINAQYGWIADGQTIKTTYLADTLIQGTVNAINGLDYVDVQIECRVIKRQSDTNISLKNVAEITDAEDILGGNEDIDSTPNDLTEEEKNNYNPGTSEEGKGYEDDDDYEELIMLPTYFDLSLRKFITGVNDREVTNRVPQVDTSPLLNGSTTANYNHTKVPVEVKKGDEVIYTIRVYNEGQVDGYVEKIVDHLPPELEFLPNDSLNKEYGWTQTDERTIETDYLRNTLLTAFDITYSI